MMVIKGKLEKSVRLKLKAGDEVLYSGTFYTARDQAHKRLAAEIKKPPINLKGAIIYYTGPTPSKYKNRVGSAGPTTSSRMDKFTPLLLDKGVAALIGKGKRSKEVIASIRKNKSIYFITIAGAGAYLSKRIKKAKVAAYKNLGAEAIYKMEVKDFPLIVAVDAKGKDIYNK